VVGGEATAQILRVVVDVPDQYTTAERIAA
jgi:hypothetical protein